MGQSICADSEREVRDIAADLMVKLLRLERCDRGNYIRYQQWVSDVFITLREAKIGEECKLGGRFPETKRKPPPIAKILWGWTYTVRMNNCTIRNHPENKDTWQRVYMPLDMYDALCKGENMWCCAPYENTEEVRKHSFVEGYTTFADLPDYSEHRVRCLQEKK